MAPDTPQASSGASLKTGTRPVRSKKTKPIPTKLEAVGITTATHICCISIWKNRSSRIDSTASAAPQTAPTTGPINAAKSWSSTRKKQHANIEARVLVFIRRRCEVLPCTDDPTAIVMPPLGDQTKANRARLYGSSAVQEYSSIGRLDNGRGGESLPVSISVPICVRTTSTSLRYTQ